MAPYQAHDGSLMPGMATNAQLDQLRALSGQAAEIFYLQLMMQHHTGGIAMAQGYVELAKNPAEKSLAAVDGGGPDRGARADDDRCSPSAEPSRCRSASSCSRPLERSRPRRLAQHEPSTAPGGSGRARAFCPAVRDCVGPRINRCRKYSRQRSGRQQRHVLRSATLSPMPSQPHPDPAGSASARRTPPPATGRQGPDPSGRGSLLEDVLAIERAQRLTDVVTRLRRALRSSIRTDYPWESLPMAQVELLQTLAAAPLRVGELAARQRLAPNTVSGLVGKLLEAGFVDRQADPGDRRTARIALTEAGQQQLLDWQQAHERRIANALAHPLTRGPRRGDGRPAGPGPARQGPGRRHPRSRQPHHRERRHRHRHRAPAPRTGTLPPPRSTSATDRARSAGGLRPQLVHGVRAPGRPAAARSAPPPSGRPPGPAAPARAVPRRRRAGRRPGRPAPASAGSRPSTVRCRAAPSSRAAASSRSTPRVQPDRAVGERRHRARAAPAAGRAASPGRPGRPRPAPRPSGRAG